MQDHLTGSSLKAARTIPDCPDHGDVGEEISRGRRKFLKSAGLVSTGVVLASVLPFQRVPFGALSSPAYAAASVIKSKEELTVLQQNPVCLDTPAHLLDDLVTPLRRHFVRNNGIPPSDSGADDWKIEIHGLVEQPASFTIEDLRNTFETVTRQLVLECAGNGRAFFKPEVPGCQWALGAVACSEWTGVRLADILRWCGVRREAVYTAHEGADTHLSGTQGRLTISRGIPIDKALNPGNLVAFGMNGKALHPLHGAPVRLLVPGWPGSCSQKWLTRIGLIDNLHDGPGMTGNSYRVPRHPVLPGEETQPGSAEVIHSMPVKSLITSIADGTEVDDRTIDVAGHAWAGDRVVSTVDVSIDFGASWQKADLQPPRNAYAWQRWSATVEFPVRGHYEIWSRATDDRGIGQPFDIAWNSKGYLNNSVHRLAVQVTG